MFLILASTIWGLSFPIGRYALDTISPLALSSLRYMFGSLALLPLAWRWRHRLPISNYTGDDNPYLWLKTGFICGTLLAVGTALQLKGLAHSTASKAAFLTTLYVSLVPILAFVGGQLPRPIIWAGLGVGLLGLFLLTGGGATSGGFNQSDGLLLVANVFWALQVLVTGRYALRMNVWLFTFAQAFVCFIESLILALYWGDMPTWHEFIITLPTTAWGIASIGLAFVCQTIAQREISSTSAALILPLQAVIGAVAGVIFLNEYMSTTMIWGAVILILGSFIAQFAKEPITLTPESQNWKMYLSLRWGTALTILASCVFFVAWAFWV
ncbi:MAG: DMT family transporter [Candidatus Adiutrix sp.]